LRIDLRGFCRQLMEQVRGAHRLPPLQLSLAQHLHAPAHGDAALVLALALGDGEGEIVVVEAVHVSVK
jgi:hypothetical protein